ncbi:facilitated trehalose transporter Tret1-like [Diorhabda sublineata]|uniref:facilitated trehalose transporter Tret1-like n=1 Tax=Diorhabda sublineata TaxID=1163346 RepID=UPI0024E15DEA|nr:facilitated trehalose transporter Tret1-like [Diorhabda sublineata]
MAKFFNYTFLVICTVGFLAVSVDVPISWTSPNYVKLYSNDSSINPLPKPITVSEDGWIGSLVTIGAIIGPIPAPYICSKFGRKNALLVSALPLITSFYMLAFAKNVYTIYVARTLGGMSLGAGYALLPIYVGEIAEDYNRGMLSQAINVFWSTGNFIVYSTGPFMSYKAFNLMIAMLPTIFFFLFLLLAPESPYYLVAENKMEKAAKSLMLLRSKDKDAVQEELVFIKDQLNDHKENGGLADLFADNIVRRAFIICLLLVFSQEMCGFSALFFYMQLIFQASGSQLSDDISSLIISVIILTSSFISPFTVDRFGRRTLIVVSCFGMCFSLAALGIFFYLLEYTSVSTEPLYWLPITSLVCFIFFFNFGMSVPWTVTAEMLPGHVKETATTIITSTSWIVAFLLTLFFNDITSIMGMGQTFWCFGLYCFVAGIMVFLFVPETKGKSFSEIQDILRYGGMFHFRSKKYVSEKSKGVEKY